jgi:TolB-like protein/Flp pilus assembly protein TadD
MDTLVYLASRASEVVSRDELMEVVWHGRVVNDSQIHKAISTLRRAFKDHHCTEEIIQTVSKRGYRLVPPVSGAESEATVQVGGPRRTTTFGMPRLVIGAALLLAGSIIAAGGSFEWLQRWWDESAARSSAVATSPEGESRAGPFAGPLAVVPFDSLSSNENDVYFAAGIHHEILSQLAETTDLEIVSGSSVLPYSGQERIVSDIAAELRAGAVLLGSVRYADNRVRVFTQLIDAASDSLIWSATYERDLEDIFAIQTEIATHVATALEAQLNVADRQRHAERLTESPEAYTFYLRAGESATTPGLPNAVRHLYLDRAIALDPAFAQAHARKADVYAVGLVVNYASGAADLADLGEVDRQVRTSAETALALDPDVESAYLALGRLHHAPFASHIGDHSTAVALATRTTELLPSESGAHFRLGTTRLYSGDYDSAIAAFYRTIELNPGHVLSHAYLAIMQAIQGDTNSALMELEVAERTNSGDRTLSHVFALIAYGYGRAGQPKEAERLAQRVEAMGLNELLGYGTCTLLALARRNEEQTLSCLRSAVDAIGNQIPDVSYHNLMLTMSNAFADPILEKSEFANLRVSANGAFVVRTFALNDDVEGARTPSTVVPAPQ